VFLVGCILASVADGNWVVMARPNEDSKVSWPLSSQGGPRDFTPTHEVTEPSHFAGVLVVGTVRSYAQTPDPRPEHAAVQPDRPPLTPLSAEKDRGFLRDASKLVDPLDELKYVPNRTGISISRITLEAASYHPY